MFLLVLAQIGSDGVQIVIQPLGVLLTHPAHFFNNRI
jgi:hypothetical protein